MNLTSQLSNVKRQTSDFKRKMAQRTWQTAWCGKRLGTDVGVCVLGSGQDIFNESSSSSEVCFGPMHTRVVTHFSSIFFFFLPGVLATARAVLTWLVGVAIAHDTMHVTARH